MKRSKMFRLSVLGIAALSLASCNNDDDDNPNPTPENDPEVITTVNILFEDTEGVIPAQTFTWTDTDGEGGQAPVIDLISIPAPAAYAVSIEVLDESDPNNVDDITIEILEEGAEHQFFFVPAGGADSVLTITYTDADVNGKPIGLQSLWGVSGVTNTAGSVRLVLRHELNKDGEGVQAGDLTNAGGETDIDIVFEFEAQ